MHRLNWALGIAAVSLWVVPVLWFYRRDLMKLWDNRSDKWFGRDW